VSDYISSPHTESSAPKHPLERATPPGPIANHAAADPAKPLDALLVEPASGRSCVLRWSELKEPSILR
jgi:hypothetical protein